MTNSVMLENNSSGQASANSRKTIRWSEAAWVLNYSYRLGQPYSIIELGHFKIWESANFVYCIYWFKKKNNYHINLKKIL